MDITVYGENRFPVPHVFVLYCVEDASHPDLVEIFRQLFPFMPRYESGDIIKFSHGTDSLKDERRYVVDRVVNYIVCLPEPPDDKKFPQFQNQIYVILRSQQLINGSEKPVRKLPGEYEYKLSGATSAEKSI